MKRFAFTLAEVLITLAIIGVVAAITIPSLMNKIQDAQFKNAAKEAYSKASQAVQNMRANEGDLSDYYATFQSFKPAFMKYFKVSRDCNARDCVPLDSTMYKSLANTSATDALWFFDDGQFITTDGMLWMFKNDPGVYPTIILITVDVNGFKKPNVFGQDVFEFTLLKGSDKLLPNGATGAAFPLSDCGTNDNHACCNRTTATSYTGLSCMYNVMQGIDY